MRAQDTDAMTTEATIKTAVNAVLAGAQMAEAAKASQVVGAKGSLRDIVTQADLDISALLIDKLSVTGLPVISEEKSLSGNQTPERFWAVDPIDGTANFANGLAHYAVSAGLVNHQTFEVGVVCAPSIDELYFTLGNGRAVLNGRPIGHVHRTRDEALCAASFAARGSVAQYELFRLVNENTRGCLRTGSAALNICWAATGKLQLAYGFDAKIWDVAGALAIAGASGCKVAIRYQPQALTLDYCVGSDDAVAFLIETATAQNLWEAA